MSGTKVVLGVSGSIASFKAAQLASDLVNDGYEVRAVLTAGAARFVAPLTFSAITGFAATADLWNREAAGAPIGHLDLARWADVLLVAPASANTIARLAHGMADDALTATALSLRVPLLLAPAMETAMYEHPATQDNLRALERRGAVLIGPERGRLASGAHGIGRMSESSTIVQTLKAVLSRRQSLSGRRILITAGPTYEAIDAVRFVGNHSSGKMGYAIAQEAVWRGADVTLVSGPVSLPPPSGATLIRVTSAREMLHAALEHASETDVAIMAAAVADFAPEVVSDTKLQRDHGLELRLLPTEDIARAVADAAPDAIHIGFALESEALLSSAREKLHRKGLHLVVANEISDGHTPFGADANQVHLVTSDDTVSLPLLPKSAVAARILNEVERLLRERHDS